MLVLFNDILKNIKIIFFKKKKNASGSWKGYDTEQNQDTTQQRKQQEKEETPTAGWRERVDGEWRWTNKGCR